MEGVFMPFLARTRKVTALVQPAIPSYNGVHAGLNMEQGKSNAYFLCLLQSTAQQVSYEGHHGHAS